MATNCGDWGKRAGEAIQFIHGLEKFARGLMFGTRVDLLRFWVLPKKVQSSDLFRSPSDGDL